MNWISDTKKKPKGFSHLYLRYILPALLLLPGVFAVFYYVLGPALGFMTGDCTDSLRWAQASVESGKLVSDNFYYAAVLPFGGNLLFAPFVALFGYGVSAQIAGLAVFAALTVGAMYFMVSGAGMGRVASCGFVSVALLILSSGAKLREIMWEHIFYYNLGVVFFCFGMGLVLRVLRQKGEHADMCRNTDLRKWGLFGIFTLLLLLFCLCSLGSLAAFGIMFFVLVLLFSACAVRFAVMRKKGKADLLPYLQCTVLCVFSALCALNGLQSLVCYTLPLLCGMAGERLLDGRQKLLSKGNLPALVLLLCLGIGTLGGMAFTSLATGGIRAPYADAYSQYSASSSWTNNFLGFFPNWFSLIGVSVQENEMLASMPSVWNALRIVCALFLLVFPIVMLCRYRKLQHRGTKVILLGHMAVSAFILFAVTFGRLGNVNWRLTPMLATAVFASLTGVWDMMTQKECLTQVRLGVLCLALLCLAGLRSGSELAAMPASYHRDGHFQTVADTLEEKGLHYGYANFWWAQLVTMLSDNAVQVAQIYEGQSSPVQYIYQLPLDAYQDKDTDRYFLLLTESENRDMQNYLQSMRQGGSIIEEFTVQTAPFAVRQYSGDTVYVYVFSENLF